MEAYLQNHTSTDPQYSFYRDVPALNVGGGYITLSTGNAVNAYSMLESANLSGKSPQDVWAATDEANRTEERLVQELAQGDDSLCRAVAGMFVSGSNDTESYIMSLDDKDPTDFSKPFMGNLPLRIAELQLASILKDAGCGPLQPDPKLTDWSRSIVAQAKVLPDHKNEPRQPSETQPDNAKRAFLEDYLKDAEWLTAHNLTHASQLQTIRAAELGYFLVHNETRDAWKDAPSFQEIVDLANRTAPTIPPDSFRAWEYGGGASVYHDAVQNAGYNIDDPPYRWRVYVAIAEASGDPATVLDGRASSAT